MVGDLGNGADLEKLVLVAGHEHHVLVLAHVDRERDAHAGEGDGVIERDQPQDLFGLPARAGCLWVVPSLYAPYEVTNV